MTEDVALANEWHIAISSKSLAEGMLSACQVLGQSLVLWRYHGEPIAWLDLCIHRGAKLSLGEVKNGCVVCPYHGWTYGRDGKCVSIPAQPPNRTISSKAKTFPVKVKEFWGAIWVCFGDDPVEVPSIPEFENGALRIHVSSHSIRAKAPRIVENYLDFSHLPFIHGNYLGDPEQPLIEDYRVSKSENGLYAKDLKIYQPDPDGSGIGGVVSYDYFCYRPLIASFTKMRMRSVLAVTPVDDENSLAWLIGVNADRDNISDEEAEKWSTLIIEQDAVVVESQRPELLPLDLQEELHFYFDRLAIAYRRWLRQLNWTYGVD